MLTVTSSSQSSERSLAPAPGVTPPPTEGSSYRFLSDVIIARGLVQPAAMKTALQASLAGRSLTDILVDNGHLGEDDLARTLAEHHRLDHVDLEVFEVDTEAASLIEPDVAQRFGAVPIAVLASGVLVVALHDPNGSTAALEFARLTGRVIQPAVASRSQVETLIGSLRHKHPVDAMLRAASSNAGAVLGQAAAFSAAGHEPVGGGQAVAFPASPVPCRGPGHGLPGEPCSRCRGLGRGLPGEPCSGCRGPGRGLPGEPCSGRRGPGRGLPGEPCPRRRGPGRGLPGEPCSGCRGPGRGLPGEP